MLYCHFALGSRLLTSTVASRVIPSCREMPAGSAKTVAPVSSLSRSVGVPAEVRSLNSSDRTSL